LFRLIAMDLDGTLLDQNNTISPRNNSVLTRLHRRGLRIVACTARAPYASGLPIPELFAFDGLIGCNGALIYRQGKVFAMHYHTAEAIRTVYLRLEKEIPGVRFGYNAVSDTVMETNYDPRTIWPDTRYRQIRFPQEIGPGIKLLIPLDGRCTYEKVCAGLEPDMSPVCIDRGAMSQVMPEGVDKSRALLELAASWDIGPEEILSFGDDYNDLEMLRVSGRGVAMENAEEAVKRAADDVAPPHDADGIARYLLAHDGELDGRA